MIPSAFMFLASLPLTTTGKIDRKALPDPGEEGPNPQGQFIAPRDDLELHLVQIWEDVLRTHPIGVTDDFFQLGGHSLLAVRLMSVIRKELGSDLPLTALFRGATVQHLAELLRRQETPLAFSPLVALQPQGARPPFFCIHPIGGQVLCYYHLAQRLGREQPFYGLQAPELASLSADSFVPIKDMAAQYVEALRAVRPEGPYLLGGYSFGSTVAFEMAVQLQGQGFEVPVLALLDGWSPALDRLLRTIPDDALLLYGLTTEYAHQNGKASPVSYADLKALGRDAQFDYVLEQLRRVDLMSSEADLAWVRRTLDGYRMRYQATLDYVPGFYRGRILLFTAGETDEVQLNYLRERGWDLSDRTRGWAEFGSGPVEIHTVPGRHETILQEPHVQVLAQKLKACMEVIG